jgi:triacylglycerol esterase/lipase EstA (alpha/beta hydrolase family)
VLLVPGTTLNPTTDFSYGWEPALRRLGYPYCTIDLPGNAMANIETAGEYVVSAIRTMYGAYGERIDIIGHSQGGMVPRWVLRFWPDTRAMVNDLIGLSPSNHGTLDAIPLCEVGCAASIWQQRSNAKFIAALNSRQETFAGVSYTDVYTLTDEVVVPNFGPAATYPHVPAEPRLACYVTATCLRSPSRRHRVRSGWGSRAAAARRSP